MLLEIVWEVMLVLLLGDTKKDTGYMDQEWSCVHKMNATAKPRLIQNMAQLDSVKDIS